MLKVKGAALVCFLSWICFLGWKSWFLLQLYNISIRDIKVVKCRISKRWHTLCCASHYGLIQIKKCHFNSWLIDHIWKTFLIEIISCFFRDDFSYFCYILCTWNWIFESMKSGNKNRFRVSLNKDFLHFCHSFGDFDETMPKPIAKLW